MNQTPPPLQSPLYEICSGLHRADLHAPPKRIRRLGAVIVGVDGEMLVVMGSQILTSTLQKEWPLLRRPLQLVNAGRFANRMLKSRCW